MSMRIINLIFFVCLIIFLPGHAAISMTASISPGKMLIGEQSTLSLFVVTDTKGHQIEFPSIEELNKKYSCLEFIARDVKDSVTASGKYKFTCKYTFTSFEDSLYYIEPITVLIDGKKYKSDDLSVKIEPVSIDTTDLIGYGPKGVVDVYVDWTDNEVRFIWFISCLLIGLILFFIAYEFSFLNRKPLFQKEKKKSKILPQEWARSELVNIQKKLTEGSAKTFYTMLTNALRNYIWLRFKIPANEMTSTEIIRNLRQIHDKRDKEIVYDLQKLFATADLVKFAKLENTLEERKSGILLFENYLNATIPESEDTTPEIKEDIPNESSFTSFEKKKNLIITSLFFMVLVYMIYIVLDYILLYL